MTWGNGIHSHERFCSSCRTVQPKLGGKEIPFIDGLHAYWHCAKCRDARDAYEQTDATANCCELDLLR